MSDLAYYGLWLAAALALTAFASAAIARHLRLREMRRVKAAGLLEALQAYSEWVAAQRRATFFTGEEGEAHEFPLEQARKIAAESFPALAEAMLEVYVVHARLIDFLWTQQAFRQRDPEAWLVSDHEARFIGLWHRHCHAVDAVAQALASESAALPEVAATYEPLGRAPT